MTKKKECNSDSNSFVAAAEQICLQPILEHRQRRGRRSIVTRILTNLKKNDRISVANFHQVLYRSQNYRILI